MDLSPGNSNHPAHRARRTDDSIRIVKLRITGHEINLTEMANDKDDQIVGGNGGGRVWTGEDGRRSTIGIRYA
jgi:hypothetical protein